MFFSILIPAYNCEKYIQKCIDSLLNQTYKNINIIIANDGSNDNTKSLLSEYIKNFSNIIVFDKENEKSISKTRNFLLTKIKSEYFTFFDADDYAEPEYIENLITNLQFYNADISMCSKSRHREHKNINLKKENLHLNSIFFFNQEEAIAEMLSSNLYNGTVYCKLFKSSLLKNCQFDPKIHYGEDLDFCFKIMKNANKFVYSNKKLYHYIIRKGSIVTSKFKESKLTCLDCYDIIINQVKNNKTLTICAKSMQGLIAIELLYYTWRDHFKNKEIKLKLKQIIKNSKPFIKQNKRLSKLLKCSPYVLWLTKFF
jgi:glycosyltransferase involved in cell wall biosynthesis